MERDNSIQILMNSIIGLTTEQLGRDVNIQAVCKPLGLCMNRQAGAPDTEKRAHPPCNLHSTVAQSFPPIAITDVQEEHSVYY